MAKEKDLPKMEKGKRILLIGFLMNLITVILFISSVGAGSRIYYGQVVGIEFSVLQVRGMMVEFPHSGVAIRPT